MTLPAVAAGLAGGSLLSLVVGIAVVGGAASTSAGDPGTVLLTGPLAPGAVPDPALLPWVTKAGSLCPAIAPALIAAQIQVESTWNAQDLSPAGAEGIAQFMPGTFPSYAADDDGTGNVSAFNPADAIVAAGRYDCALVARVRALAETSGTPALSLALAAYNAGPRAVADAGGIPPLVETQDYVARVEALAATYVQVSPTGVGQGVVAAALQWVGTPYVWGGGSSAGPTGNPAGFDCSGLTAYAVYQATHGALSLPHSSELQAAMGQAIPLSAAEPGDLIALQLTAPGDYDHIVIYAGTNQVIAAPQTGGVVQIQPLSDFAGMASTVRRFA
jgi:cell wall-associated NlpC family hydrolase